MDYGETVLEALRREVQEELGISNYEPQAVKNYIYRSTREDEMVYVFKTVYDGNIHPDAVELNGGRFWSMHEIKENIGKDIFTPNFEMEFSELFLSQQD